MAVRPRVVGAAVAAYGVGVAAAYEYYTASKASQRKRTSEERKHTFALLATLYDQKVANDESSSGIEAMRHEMLASRARGRVLELATGTARNLEYYAPDHVKSLVLVDNCTEMLRVAAQKVAELRAAREAPGFLSEVTLAVADAAALPFPTGSFETVVDTFGLCSFEEPSKAVDEMARVAAPGGAVLLLEHGVSHFAPLRWWQAHRHGTHVHSWGCYWDRDIESIVRGCASLEVKSVERRHLGTTLLFVCERRPDVARNS